VLLTLSTLLCNNPLLNEPGIKLSNPELVPYNKIIEYQNINVAILQMLNKKKGVYLPEFSMFDEVIRDSFFKNQDKILEFIDEKIISEPEKIIRIKQYDMVSNVNYNKLKMYFLQTLDMLSNSNTSNTSNTSIEQEIEPELTVESVVTDTNVTNTELELELEPGPGVGVAENVVVDVDANL
jgi:hypothetical protein